MNHLNTGVKKLIVSATAVQSYIAFKSAKGDVTINELAAHAGVSRTSIGHLMSEWTKAGLVQRRQGMNNEFKYRLAPKAQDHSYMKDVALEAEQFKSQGPRPIAKVGQGAPRIASVDCATELERLAAVLLAAAKMLRES